MHGASETGDAMECWDSPDKKVRAEVLAPTEGDSTMFLRISPVERALCRLPADPHKP